MSIVGDSTFTLGQKQQLVLSTNTEALKIISTDTLHSLRKLAAANIHTPADTLTFLAKDENSKVRRSVATNPSTPTDSLTILALDNDMYVRAAVAGNANLCENMLTVLANDSCWPVRYALLSNTNLPLTLWKKLAKDPEDHVCEKVELLRQAIIVECASTLPLPFRSYAMLLAPTFTEWPDTLFQAVESLVLAE